MKTLLTLGLLIISFQSFGQLPYSQGYIVRNNGDTLKGFIRNEQWIYAPKKIEFTTQKEMKGEIYSLRDLKALSVLGKVYQRHFVTYDGDDSRTRSLPKTRDPQNFVRDTALVEVLYVSKYSLYFMQSRNDRLHYFIAIDNGELEELLNRDWMKVDNIDIVMKNQRWKQQLINLTFSCPSTLKEQIKKASYEESDLTDIIEKINKCLGGALYKKSKETKLPIKRPSLGIVFAPSLYQPLFTFSPDTRKMDLQYSGGVLLQFFSRKYPDRISFYNELTYRKVKASTKSYAGYNFWQVDYSVNSLKLVNMVRISNPGRRLSFFVNGGLVTASRRPGSAHLVYPGRPQDGQKVNVLQEGGLEAGACLGAGVTTLNRVPIALELRFEHLEGLGDSEFIKSKALAFIASIRF